MGNIRQSVFKELLSETIEGLPSFEFKNVHSEVESRLHDYFESRLAKDTEKVNSDLFYFLISNAIEVHKGEYYKKNGFVRFSLEGVPWIDCPLNWGIFKKLDQKILKSKSSEIVFLDKSDSTELVRIMARVVAGLKGILFFYFCGTICMAFLKQSNELRILDELPSNAKKVVNG